MEMRWRKREEAEGNIPRLAGDAVRKAEEGLPGAADGLRLVGQHGMPVAFGPVDQPPNPAIAHAVFQGKALFGKAGAAAERQLPTVFPDDALMSEFGKEAAALRYVQRGAAEMGDKPGGEALAQRAAQGMPWIIRHVDGNAQAYSGPEAHDFFQRGAVLHGGPELLKLLGHVLAEKGIFLTAGCGGPHGVAPAPALRA